MEPQALAQQEALLQQEELMQRGEMAHREALFTPQGDKPLTSATIFALWADIAQAAGDRARAQLYIECAFTAMDRLAGRPGRG